ncbi:thioredoxin-like protein [Phlebopus sp. FC_14]|nr:thioredoxin-like protein [Phlebopus sp. FC_14]
MPFNSINNTQEFANIINSGRVVVVDFYANWSLWSQYSTQQFSDFSETFKRIGVDFCRVDVDELEDVAMEADVRVVPTFMVFKDGKKVGYAEGVDSGNLHKLMGSHVAGWTVRVPPSTKELRAV